MTAQIVVFQMGIDIRTVTHAKERDRIGNVFLFYKTVKLAIVTPLAYKIHFYVDPLFF